MYTQQTAAWNELDITSLFVVSSNVGLRAEAPFEQVGRIGEDPKEVMIRVFINKDEAERYRDTLAVYDQYSGYKVEKVNLDALFQGVENMQTHYTLPIRIDLCSMPHEEHPRSVMCIRTTRETLH